MITKLLLLSGLVGLPNHPNDIQFPEYNFTAPTSSEFRYELSNGVPVYIVEDRELPLIDVSFAFRGGTYLDPEDGVGLSSMMAGLVRDGGTASLSADELDEKFDFLAAGASVVGGTKSVSASLNSLSSNFDESFPLFVDMVINPGFQESRIKLNRDGIIETLKQRNDHPSGILRRETASILYGDSYMGRSVTLKMVESVTRDDLMAMHSRIVNPSNLVIAVSGDFNKEEMLQTLEDQLGEWSFGEKSAAPPSIDSVDVAGIYYVDQDVSQGGVRIVLRSLRRDDEDLVAAMIMNYILGGGGFSSRITQTVRSDEGLAYSAGSFLAPGVYMDGVWGAGYESKSTTVALAASLVFDEIKKIKEKLVSEDDLALAKGALVEQFPSTFQSKSQTIGVFVDDEMTERDPDFWSVYKDRVEEVTREDVMRVANKLLDTNKMAMIIVGDWVTISDGNDRSSMIDVSNVMGGEVSELPLRDPLTLEPIK